MTRSLIDEPGFIPYENPFHTTSSLIPGTYCFAKVSKEEMAETSFFKNKEISDYTARETFHTGTRYDSLSGRLVEYKTSLKGWEVVYPNGKVCSHLFHDKKSAQEFIDEVKRVRSER